MQKNPVLQGFFLPLDFLLVMENEYSKVLFLVLSPKNFNQSIALFLGELMLQVHRTV